MTFYLIFDKILDNFANSSRVRASPLIDDPLPSSSMAALICSFEKFISGELFSPLDNVFRL